MRIFHLTTPEVWEPARQAGTYTMSTRGRTLEQQGFIHCSTAHQVEAVRKLCGDLDAVVGVEPLTR